MEFFSNFLNKRSIHGFCHNLIQASIFKDYTCCVASSFYFFFFSFPGMKLNEQKLNKQIGKNGNFIKLVPKLFDALCSVGADEMIVG